MGPCTAGISINNGVPDPKETGKYLSSDLWIFGDGTDFKQDDVYDGDCSDFYLDHSVVIVGYGTTENGVAFWKIRNRFLLDFF